MAKWHKLCHSCCGCSKGFFGVWCAKSAKYLAFGTFGISVVDAPSFFASLTFMYDFLKPYFFKIQIYFSILSIKS